MISDDYKKSIRRRPKNKEKYARPFLPSPDVNDYERGYITRYFAKQRNNLDYPIVEIDKTQFDSHPSNNIGLNFSFYQVLSLRWRITGDAKEVQQSNFNTVQKLDSVMPGIKLKLGNTLQFYKK